MSKSDKRDVGKRQSQRALIIHSMGISSRRIRGRRREAMGRIDREDSRRNQLIEATIDTMAEVGFSATTLALIGQRAGISPGLVAHYFRDKDVLLEATLRSLASRLARATTDHLATASGPRQRIQA